MLQKLTSVKVVDNTGVVDATVIQLFSGNNKYARLGDFVRVSTQSIKKLKKTKKTLSNRRRRIIFRKKRRMGTVVRVRRQIAYRDGATVFFKDNAIILYKKRKMLRGKRFYGLTTRMVGFEKIIRKFLIYI